MFPTDGGARERKHSRERIQQVGRGTTQLSQPTPMISVEGLRKSIRNGSPGTVDILKGLDFTVPQGQFAAVMGSSGSGKSTLLGLWLGSILPVPAETSI